MHYPFLVADPRSGVQYRPSDTILAELSLAPLVAGQPRTADEDLGADGAANRADDLAKDRANDWTPARLITAHPDPVWAESLANAPAETIAAVTRALEDLILATPDLRPPSTESLPTGRAKRHLDALIGLWHALGPALPQGLAPLRHVLELPMGRFLDPMPVVEGSLDPLAPPAMRALYARLRHEFGTEPPARHQCGAAAGSRLHALQGGIAAQNIATGPADQSLGFYGLRDLSGCAEFAAARARTLIDQGIAARDIAVLSSGEPQRLARAFAAQGIALSGLPKELPQRDIIGETALHLAMAKCAPAPAMALASLALSPLMPWSAQTGRDLAESLMRGDRRGMMLSATASHLDLWKDIRAAAGSLAQLRLLMDRICARLAQGEHLRARLALPAGDGPPDWDKILRAIQISAPTGADPWRNLEGVSLWSAQESPWRSCRHLIVADFTDGSYPARPRANPLFLDSEIDAIRAATGLELSGRATALARGLQLFDQQLQAVSDSVTFLIPWRDLAGARLQASAGLSLVARAIAGIREAGDLVEDLSRIDPADWPVAHHRLSALPEPAALPEFLSFPGQDLLALRRNADGTARPQSPSRLETLLVSPLAWLLAEIGAEDCAWSAETLDIKTKGSIAHDVFEQIFPAGDTLPAPDVLRADIDKAFDRALSRHAAFLRSPSWDMERQGLRRDILDAALRWREHLQALQARIIGNEIWLAGEAHGINLHGKADTILELPDGAVLIVDHKKSGTSGRRSRMEAGWDLQAGLYRDMVARPRQREDDIMAPLAGREIGIAYHLMNDGGLLSAGLTSVASPPARDMGDAVNQYAIARLAARLAELGAGEVRLNTEDDEKFFKNTAKFTPYALSDGSTLVTAFIRAAEEK